MIIERVGRYSIVETLGAGSMGAVYRAEDPESGRQVAVKLVRSRILCDMGLRERFLRDMLGVSLLCDPRICPILEIGDENDDFFVVTRLLEGETLERMLNGRSLPWRRALEVASEMLKGIEAAHAAGIIHRAVKPSNVWILPDGKIVLTDCALSRFTEFGQRVRRAPAVSRSDWADTLIPLSALSYMSPEQVKGDTLDPRSDVFSVGVVLYEMLAGRHPFEARNALSKTSAILEAEVPPLAPRQRSFPDDLDAVLQRALAKSPGDRFQTAAEFRRSLEELNDRWAKEPDASPMPGPPGRFSCSRRFLWFVAGASAVVAAAALVYATL